MNFSLNDLKNQLPKLLRIKEYFKNSVFSKKIVKLHEQQITQQA